MSSSGPSVRITSLPRNLLKFPPSSVPTTLPVPAENPTFAHPFTIPSDIYNALLSPNVPITVALVYASVVTYLNSVNAQRKYKPWAFSKTRLFKSLVIAHNVFLALYSAWTCLGMINALKLSLTNPTTGYGLAGMVDSVCKIHGPRGIGDAAVYNSTTGVWGFTNKLLHLGAEGLNPDSTDVGRIWNEGLAFYGWLFYISKFYEVIDTFIILVKGKKSSFLQTYHHAGAMMCMWAGIRYMAAPIWMFVMVNSGLHAIMYSYYTLSSLRIKVPKWFKQTITTLQITQFIVGATYAFSHLFVAYEIPISVPYTYYLGDVASAFSEDTVSAVSVLTATASAGAAAWLKKAAFRAAGREGLAENVLNQQGRTFGVDAVHAAQDLQARAETRYRDELQWVHCLDTSGQVFAILLNCMYLAPLTWLFMRFFVKAYLKRQERRRSSTASETAKIAAWASRDAIRGVKRQIDEVGAEGAITDDEGDEVENNLEDAVAEDTAALKGVVAEDITALKDAVAEDTPAENEVGDKLSPDETPELKQDDSFIRVEAEPESPTEVRSFGEDEEVVEEDDNGGKPVGEETGKVADGTGKRPGDKQKDESEFEYSEEQSYTGEKTYAEVVTSEKPDTTADTGAEDSSEAQEPIPSTDRPSEQTAESVTDDAPGSFSDELATAEKEEAPNATAETQEDAAADNHEPTTEPKLEITEEHAERQKETNVASEESGEHNAETEEAHEEVTDTVKGSEVSKKPAEAPAELEKKIDQSEESSEQAQSAPEPSSQSDEPAKEATSPSSSQPTTDLHSGFGLFDTEVDAKDALPPVSPLEAPPESKSSSASTTATDEAESGAEAVKQAGEEQSTSTADHLKVEEAGEPKKVEDDATENTTLEPLSSKGDFQHDNEESSKTENVEDVEKTGGADESDKVAKKKVDKVVESARIEPLSSKQEPQPEAAETGSVEKTGDIDETEDSKDTKEAEETGDAVKQQHGKVIEKAGIEPLASTEDTSASATEETTEEPEVEKPSEEANTNDDKHDGETAKEDFSNTENEGASSDDGNGNGKFSIEEELGIRMPSIS